MLINQQAALVCRSKFMLILFQGGNNTSSAARNMEPSHEHPFIAWAYLKLYWNLLQESVQEEPSHGMMARARDARASRLLLLTSPHSCRCPATPWLGATLPPGIDPSP